jgi:hypothetical protein
MKIMAQILQISKKFFSLPNYQIFMIRFCFFFFPLSCLEFSQNWPNYFLNDPHSLYSPRVFLTNKVRENNNNNFPTSLKCAANPRKQKRIQNYSPNSAPQNHKHKQNKGSHHGLAIYIQKYLKAQQELWNLKYFTMQKIYSSKTPLKETKILQCIITLLLLISRFNTSQTIIFQKSSYKNRPGYIT